MKLTYDILKHHDSEYNKVRALLLIILIRAKKSESERNRLKMELFMLMSKVIVKNIENFWYMAKPYKYSHHIIETSELISECFIALEIGIKNFGAEKTGNVRYNVFKVKPGTVDEYIYKYSVELDFYFYYNKTLTQRFNRMVTKMLATNARPADTLTFLKGVTNGNKQNVIDVGLLIEADFDAMEIVIAVLLCKGFTNTEISRRCKTSYSSVLACLASAREKMLCYMLKIHKI